MRPVVVPNRRLTDDELRTSMQAALAQVPANAPLWVFGYGSLIWKPESDFDERVPARIFGFHRRLCLRSVRYRGTEDCPGLVAGLDRGGSCAGIAYRLRKATLAAQFARLWEREMFLGSYAAHWLRAKRLDGGEAVRALAFVVRRDASNYCGKLPEPQVLDVLNRACGIYGSSLEYLRHTVLALRAEGLRDPHFERLLARAERGAAARDD
ncbi:MAG: gamma-glutamylcyclotransferase [Burkholderiales bacterium]|nr:gamma-glutamylcyclotransferase [Burkholderiales bacterium]